MLAGASWKLATCASLARDPGALTVNQMDRRGEESLFRNVLGASYSLPWRPPHLRHLHGQRQGVVRAREHRGVSYVDLVKMNARPGEIEPDRFRVAEEVNGMAAGRELRAERGRENSTAPYQRKTGDRNLERRRHF